MRTQTIKFGEFMKSEGIISKEREVTKKIRKKEILKLSVRAGVITLVLIHPHISLPYGTVYAAEVAATVATNPGKAWENLINKLLDLLDPIAKIFGMIAGVAIMTGNGKIGLERLFWLSIGYITTRKVDAWIGFLNGI